MISFAKYSRDGEIKFRPKNGQPRNGMASMMDVHYVQLKVRCSGRQAIKPNERPHPVGHQSLRDQKQFVRSFDLLPRRMFGRKGSCSLILQIDLPQGRSDISFVYSMSQNDMTC